MRRKRFLRLKARVQDGGRLALDLPSLPAGTAVEILLLLPKQEEPPATEPDRPPPVRRLIRSAADVELVMEVERAAWEH